MGLHPDEKKDLVRHFSNRARKADIIGTRLIAPKKYDENGDPIKPNDDGTLQKSQIFDFSLTQARFLKAWKDCEWDFDKACEAAKVDPLWAKKLANSINAKNYRQEEERDQILAQIPSKTWVTARYTEAALGHSEPSQTQQWGLDRVKEIVMPKAAANVQINNVLAMPALPPEVLDQLKSIAHQAALETKSDDAAA